MITISESKYTYSLNPLKYYENRCRQLEKELDKAYHKLWKKKVRKLPSPEREKVIKEYMKYCRIVRKSIKAL